MLLELHPEFDEILQPLGNHAIEFFLAASLYHSRKISFASAAHIAGLSFEAFKNRLEEHFNQGFLIADECVLEDIETTKSFTLGATKP
jgi:predicted HTH domain antitoxin